MFKLIVFLVFCFLIRKFLKKHPTVLKKISAAFTDPYETLVDDNNTDNVIEQSDYEPSSQISEIDQKEMIKKKYLIMYEIPDEESEETQADNNDISASEDNSAAENLSGQSCLVDENGEVCTMLDLLAAPVDQQQTTIQKINEDDVQVGQTSKRRAEKAESSQKSDDSSRRKQELADQIKAKLAESH